MRARSIPDLSASDRVRFWDKVDRRGPDDCWTWAAATTGEAGENDYGNFYLAGDYYRAHRVAYKLGHGEAPTDRHVCHSCDERLCVNPGHLFAGTAGDNMKDCQNKGRTKMTFTPERTRGARNVKAKLSPAQVRRIRRRAGAGERHTSIAADFRVSSRTVGLIVARKTWKHIP